MVSGQAAAASITPGQHVRRHEEVVAEPGLPDGGQAAVYRGAAQPVRVALDEHRVPDPPEVATVGPGLQRGQRFGYVLGLQVHPAHDAGDQIAVRGQLQQIGTR